MEPQTETETAPDFEARESAVIEFGRTLERERVATLQDITAAVITLENGRFGLTWKNAAGEPQTISRGFYGYDFSSVDRVVWYAAQKARESYVCEPVRLENGSEIERRYHKRRGVWVYVVTRPVSLSRNQFNAEEHKAQKLSGWYSREFRPNFERGGFMFQGHAAALQFANDFRGGKPKAERETPAPVSPVSPSKDFLEPSAPNERSQLEEIRQTVLNAFNRESVQPGDSFTFTVCGHVFLVRGVARTPDNSRDVCTRTVEFMHVRPDGTTETVSEARNDAQAVCGIIERLRLAFGLAEFDSEEHERTAAESRVWKSSGKWFVNVFMPAGNDDSGFPGCYETKREAVSLAVRNRRAVLCRLAGKPGGTYRPNFPPSKDFSESDSGAGSQPNAGDERAAGRLEELADGMEKTIAERLRPMTQNWTRKRGREYASRVHEGENLKRCQEALRVLAQHWRAGTVPADLRDLKTKTAVLPLVSCSWDSCHDRGTDEPRDTSPKAVALRELVSGARSPELAKQNAERARRKKIEEAETELRGRNVPGFFPTPPALVSQMIDAADIPETGRILEPSAGIGSIVDGLTAAGVSADRVQCVEVSQSCVTVLELKGYDTTQGDFLAMTPPTDYVDGSGEQFDRILMNPPFEGNADIDHVQQAYRFLRPGGRLVAIMSEGSFNTGTGRKRQAFSYWLNDVGAVSEPIHNAFNDSTAFRNTGVSVRLVVIDKP